MVKIGSRLQIALFFLFHRNFPSPPLILTSQLISFYLMFHPPASPPPLHSLGPICLFGTPEYYSFFWKMKRILNFLIVQVSWFQNNKHWNFFVLVINFTWVYNPDICMLKKYMLTAFISEINSVSSEKSRNFVTLS